MQLLIRIERTGGFTGISKHSEMDSDDLPDTLKATLTKLMNDDVNSSNSIKSIPPGAADHYAYKIIVNDGVNPRTIECSQYEIKDNLKSLVTYIEKHNNKRK